MLKNRERGLGTKRRETSAGEVREQVLRVILSSPPGQKEGDKGRLSQHRQAWRCVNASQFKEDEQEGKERG